MGTQLPLEESLRTLISNLPPISPDVCIYRVPNELRSVNEKAYTPQIVSIGPMHYGKTELQAMEEYKLRCLQEFLHRTKKSLKDCIGVVKELEERARNCYAERFDLTSDQFIKMLLLDSCLIIEIMLRARFKIGEEPTDYLSKRILTPGIMTDMVLLENQIPFLVLDAIFNLGISSYPYTNNFCDLSLCYFSTMKIFRYMQTQIDNVTQYIERGNEVKHFVDLLRIRHLPSTLRLPSDNTPNIVPIRNATYLYKAGMNIKEGVSDITYTTGVLEIPHIYVGDDSEYFLRNILAFEACHYPHDSYMIYLICFMDMLIDTAEDVDILVQNGILTNWFGDISAVVNLFNGLTIRQSPYGPKYYFHSISEDLNIYCNVRRHRWKATFIYDYCHTPWMIASTIGAILLLLLTLIQAICSIIPLV